MIINLQFYLVLAIGMGVLLFREKSQNPREEKRNTLIELQDSGSSLEEMRKKKDN